MQLKQQLWEEIEKELLENLDLDQYNITSDDLRSDKSKYVKGVNVKGHELVPKLDLTEIIADQHKVKTEKKDSSSSTDSEEEVEEDI